MIDYSKITENDIAEKEAAMPTSLRLLYESDEFGVMLMKLADDRFFDEEDAETLHVLVGLYMMGFFNERELSEEIAKNLYLSTDESDKLVEIIRDSIAAKTKSAVSTENPTKNTPLKVPVFMDRPIPRPIAPPQAKVDFATEPKTKAVATSPDIHPENIIDLKDLPR